MQNAPKQLLALDVGEKRVGIALASTLSRLAKPYTTLVRSDQILNELDKLVKSQNITAVVIGLPRGLEGQETHQTRLTREFADQLKSKIELPLYWQDEAVTSLKAEQELASKKRQTFTKAEVDALAATYILEDFLRDNPKELARW